MSSEIEDSFEPDPALDVRLAKAFEEPPLPDRGFSDAVRARLAGHRRRRRRILGAGSAISVLATALAAARGPALEVEAAELGPRFIASALIVAALTSLALLVTEAPLPGIDAGGPRVD